MTVCHNSLKLLTVVFCFLCAVLHFKSNDLIPNQYSASEIPISHSKLTLFHTEEPTIMAWNNFFSNKTKEFLESMLIGCSHKCKVIDKNESAVVTADALIFNGWCTIEPPNQRWPHQLYALYLIESPLTAQEKVNNMPTNFFNVSLTYRNESHTNYDNAYGRLKPVASKNYQLEDEKINNLLTRKTSRVLFIASNCNSSSGREVYVDELSRFIEVTRRGKCTGVEWNCKRSLRNGCDKQLIESHLFYLAFENSVCDDYITEKFFKVLSHSVPVVLKRSILKGYAPDDMFIAADDFESPRELALFLNNLSGNMTAYRRYFSWMKDYEVDTRETGVCELCTDLHLRPNRKVVIEDTQKYHSPIDQCIRDFATTIM